MSLADVTFINMCRDVIENGTSTEGEKVRPVWEDGTSAYTIGSDTSKNCTKKCYG